LIIIIGVVGFVGCTVCAGSAISDAAQQSQQREAAEAAAEAAVEADAIKQLPWLAQVQATCERYGAAPNDIQKSAVFNENQAFIKGQRLESIKGTLVGSSTAHGGSGLRLTTKLGRAEFGHGGITAGHPLYAQAATLVNDQCIVFTGTVRDTHRLVGLFSYPTLEQSRICSMSYDVVFDTITACP
jgi:hypothetical protein